MSVPQGLKRLIAASRVSVPTDGAPGESFLNNVTASAAGVKMTDYLMSSSVWSNIPASPPTLYESQSTFTDLTLTFDTFGSKAPVIQEKTTGSWTVNYISPLSTANATLNSISWLSNVGTLNLTINGELTAGTPTAAVTIWYQGYTSPCLPFPTTETSGPGGCYVCGNTGGGGDCQPGQCSSDCETAFNVNFTFSAGAVAASGSTTNDLYLAYIPDRLGAAFNYTIYGPGPTAGTSWQILQNRRPGATPVIDAVEWATDSGFTNVVSTSNPYTISSDNNTTATLYLRYKLDGAGSFTNFSGNPVSWSDPRIDT